MPCRHKRQDTLIKTMRYPTRHTPFFLTHAACTTRRINSSTAGPVIPSSCPPSYLLREVCAQAGYGRRGDGADGHGQNTSCVSAHVCKKGVSEIPVTRTRTYRGIPNYKVDVRVPHPTPTHTHTPKILDHRGNRENPPRQPATGQAGGQAGGPSPGGTHKKSVDMQKFVYVRAESGAMPGLAWPGLAVRQGERSSPVRSEAREGLS
jgi:hypothetical protein